MRKPFVPGAIVFGGAVPSAGATTSAYSPVESSSHAIDLPSGLQFGSRSATPLVRVRSRALPSFAGSDHTSPRALTSTRLPVGETSQPCANFDASTARGASFGCAPGIVTRTTFVVPVARSQSTSSGPCWNTTSPVPFGPGPIDGHFTS